MKKISSILDIEQPNYH